MAGEAQQPMVEARGLARFRGPSGAGKTVAVGTRTFQGESA
jgi:hypothetical protein